MRKNQMMVFTISSLKIDQQKQLQLIKIDGEQITLKDVEGEQTYHYDSQNDEFTKDSETYNCLFNNGTLLLVGDGSDNEPLDYVSPESSWYSGYEQGKVKIEK